MQLAGKTEPDTVEGCLEILTLAGALSGDGAPLHMNVANAEGRVTGGQFAYGCTVRTTVEMLLVQLPDWSFTREHDPNTGFLEFVPRSKR